MIFEPADFFVLRTPLLPIKTVLNLSDQGLRDVYCHPDVLEALYIAAPEFFDAFQRSKNVSSPKKLNEIEITLLKYLLRMSTRCTPFGLFAGISVGYWGEKTDIMLPSRTSYRRYTRLDMDYLCKLSAQSIQTSSIRKQLKYFTNNTLYRVGEYFRYIEYRIGNTGRTHHLINLKAFTELEQIFTLARNGCYYQDLVNKLVSPDISINEATDFINEIINSQLLLSELEPAVTGKDYLNSMISDLDKLEVAREVREELSSLSKLLTQIDQMPLGINLLEYERIISHLETFEIGIDKKKVFHIDLSKPLAHKKIGPEVFKELNSTLNFLVGITDVQELDTLKQFKKAFINKYEQQEILLNEALDFEIGIGYPNSKFSQLDSNPLLDQIPERHENENLIYNVSKWSKLVFKRYLDAIKRSDKEIDFTNQDISTYFSKDIEKLPTSLYSMISLFGESLEAIDKGEFEIFHRITTGPSAANLLGRFCNEDEELSLSVQQIIKREEDYQPDIIFAEVVHFNQPRIANISTRPVFRDYEIPIISPAGVNENSTIQLSDLVISVKNDRLVLRSIRLNKEVRPRLSTAHNHTLLTVPHYHFLCDLQFQDNKCPLLWNWGFLRNAQFLPRVRFGKTILAKARWFFEENDFTDILLAAENGVESAFTEFRTKYNLPQWISVIDGDNELPIDLENKQSIRLLQSILRQKKALLIEEYLFAEANAVIKDSEGSFANELIIPIKFDPTPRAISTKLTTLDPHNKVQSDLDTASQVSVTRTFDIGSDWIYFKLYCGSKISDAILTDHLYPLIKKFLFEKEIDQWFFVRYSDPESHLRVRLHLNTFTDRKVIHGKILNDLHICFKPFLEARLISRFSMESYNRELERYGTDLILDIEKLFFYDSEFVVNLLKLYQDQNWDDLRWLLGLKTIDIFLSDLKLNILEKSNFVERISDSYSKEFHHSEQVVRDALGKTFRNHKLTIESILRQSLLSNQDLIPFQEILAGRSRNNCEVISRIYKNIINTGRFDEIISSYIHMSMNRLLSTRQRKQEAILYNYLVRYYKSELAKTA